MSTTNIFDTLAQQDTQNITHDQSLAATPAAQPNIFDTLARHETELQGGQQQKGPTLSAQPTSADFHPEDMASDPFIKAGLKMTTPFARKLIDAVDKLREVENFTPEGKQEHPVQAHLGEIANKIEGFLFGSSGHGENIGTGKYGMANNPVLAATMGAPGAAEAAGGAENAIREGISSLKGAGQTAEEGPGLVKQVLKGKELEQAPAKQGLQAAAKGAGGKEGSSIRTALEQPIKDSYAEASKAYHKIDEASGTDFKALISKIQDAEQQARLSAAGSIEQAQWEEKASGLRFSKDLAEEKAAREGVPMSTLKEADEHFKRASALGDVESKIFKNPTNIAGNVEHGSQETVNVNSTIKALQRLQDNTKYGAPRLEQAFGKKGAKQLLDDLYAAQRLGVESMSKQQLAIKIAKYGLPAATAAGGLAYEVLK